MTLTELKYIIALAQEKHFGRAANACFVSQPTLSVGIKKLEDELNIILFERNKNEIRVTQQAEAIIEQAQTILEEVEKLKSMATAGKNQLNGCLKIGAIFTVGPYLFPNLIPKLKKLAPDMPIIVEEDFTANLRKKLSAGQLDIIIISLPFKEGNILTKPIYDENFVVLLPFGHPLAKYAELTPEMIQAENVLLLGEGHCFRDQVLEYCPQCLNTSSKSIGIKPGTIEGSSLETIRMMVASGLGITILPERAAQSKYMNNQLLTIRPFLSPQPKRAIAIAWRSSFPRPKVIDILSKALN